MILTYGNTQAFKDLGWYMLELRSERTIESTLRRLGQSIPNIFRESPIELFVPTCKRDLNVFDLSTGTYVFVRSPDFTKLLRLKSITGIVGLATYGDSNHPSKVIPVENEYVQTQIAAAHTLYQNAASLISIGAFVRILDGEMRDWCGTVINLHDGTAFVRVEIKTKILIIETPTRNLLDKSDVPKHLQVFYYGDMVDSLVLEGLADLVAPDLHYVEDTSIAADGLTVSAPKRHSRQQTVTALVKRLVVTGTHDPLLIGTKVLQALKEGALKKPKNLSIVHSIIKSRLIFDHFRKLDPTIHNYREVVERFGVEWKFSLQDLAALDTESFLPLTSDETEDSHA